MTKKASPATGMYSEVRGTSGRGELGEGTSGWMKWKNLENEEKNQVSARELVSLLITLGHTHWSYLLRTTGRTSSVSSRVVDDRVEGSERA